MTITQRKDNLSSMLHGGTLNKVRNIDLLFERSANTLLSKIDPVDTIRIIPLSSTIHDDIYNYSLPSDFKYTQAAYTELCREKRMQRLNDE